MREPGKDGASTCGVTGMWGDWIPVVVIAGLLVLVRLFGGG